MLLALDEMGIIKPSGVSALQQPFSELRLVQAVAKVEEYHSAVKDEEIQLHTVPGRIELTEDGKSLCDAVVLWDCLPDFLI